MLACGQDHRDTECRLQNISWVFFQKVVQVWMVPNILGSTDCHNRLQSWKSRFLCLVL